ncbi:MAG: haloacid dehalogenase-like hydrolase [Clostridia bacterium]|nr:haloacid dehalogenase-like hydrolase [Clostridia bacterium]
MLIDVYDFDGTIYDGDSTADFVLFSLRRHPGVIAGLPRVAFAALRLLVRNIGLTQFKSVLFGEMSKRFSLEEEAELFWKDMNTRKKLGPWFFETPRDLPIVIASASPEFELRHAAKILGVDTLIGTKCDMKTGALTGKNCKGAEKISRIREVIGDYEVRAMYTDDAKADGPLLAIAREQYIVTHGSVTRRA